MLSHLIDHVPRWKSDRAKLESSQKTVIKVFLDLLSIDEVKLVQDFEAEIRSEDIAGATDIADLPSDDGTINEIAKLVNFLIESPAIAVTARFRDLENMMRLMELFRQCAHDLEDFSSEINAVKQTLEATKYKGEEKQRTMTVVLNT